MNNFTRKLKHYGLDDKNYPFGDSVLNAALVGLIGSCILLGFVGWNFFWWHGLATMTVTDFSCPYTLTQSLLFFVLVAGIFGGCHFFSGKLMQQKKGNLWYLSLHLITVISVFIAAVINTIFFAAISRYYGDGILVFTKNYVISYQWQYYAYFALALFSWVCLMKCRKPKEEDEIVVESTSGKLGGAQLASSDYLRHQGMIPRLKNALRGDGQLIGKLGGEDYIVLQKFVHSLIIAPPQSGKAVSGSIPLILDSLYATLVLDMKAELFLSTWEECIAKKRKPIAFAPTGLLCQYGDFHDMLEINFNPLKTKFIMNAITREKYLDSLVKGLTVDIAQASNEKHFIDLAVPIIKVMVNDYLGTDKTLVDLYRELINITLEKLIKRFKTILKLNPDYLLLQNVLGVLEDTTERELSGIRNTYKRALSFLSNPIWTQCFGKDGIDMYDYAVGQHDLFIMIDQSTVESYPKAIRFLFSLVKSTFDTLPPEVLAKNNYPIVLDEIAQIGPLEEIERIYELFGDKGVTLHLFFQDLDQVEKFNKSGLLKSFILKQFFSVRDTQTIEWIQKLVGKQTVLLNNTSHGSSISKSKNPNQLLSNSHNKSHSSSESISETGTELLHTDFIRELDDDQQIVLYKNLKPFVCDKCFYYKDARYSDRASTNLVYYRDQIDHRAAKQAQADFNQHFIPFELKRVDGSEQSDAVLENIPDEQTAPDVSVIGHPPLAGIDANKVRLATTKYSLEDAIAIYKEGMRKKMTKTEILEHYLISNHRYNQARKIVSEGNDKD